MTDTWTLERLQIYIDDSVEESLNLEYKSGDALAKTDGKKKDVTKDVSAMANSDGGLIIYGISESQDHEKRHLPEKISPIDRREIPKEWLEQVINSIPPRIEGVTIYPIPLRENPNSVVYVVEIPPSTTAHQAQDYRYYKRVNFESIPMEDYEVRDIMHRASKPEAQVEFGFEPLEMTRTIHRYRLGLILKNTSAIVIQRFKLRFTFPQFIQGQYVQDLKEMMTHNPGSFSIYPDGTDNVIEYRSDTPLFPFDELNLGKIMNFVYQFDDQAYNLSTHPGTGSKTSVKWNLYADDMLPKKGEIPISELNKY